MSELDVRIIRLEPIHVAASYGFGSGPEGIAWEKMFAFVDEKGLRQDGQNHRYFGFNNPSPTPGSPNYGYEQWVTVAPDATTAGDIKIKDFDGGLYAVARCQLKNITQAWQELVAWRAKSPYRPSNHQWLEECIFGEQGLKEPNEEQEFDLYLPIVG